MLNCIQQKNTAVVASKSPDISTTITTTQNQHNSRLRFLILLPESDYDKYIYSYKDIIWFYRNKFPGVLTIEKFEDADQLPYLIEEPVMPRQLYIMLPKERVYVPSDCFTGRYIRSKMRELVQIFVTLRASSIKYVRYDSEEEMNNTHVDIGMDFPQFTFSEGLQIDNMSTKRTGTEYEIRLSQEDCHDAKKDPIDINVFFSPSFYYLKREPSWRDMISRRIECGVVYDKYTYWNKEMKLLKGSFIQEMKYMNLSVEYDWKKYNDFMVEYEVSY